jgi:hypothetical protein
MRRKIGRLAAGLTLAVATTTGALIGTSGSAFAAPTGCSTSKLWGPPGAIVSECTGGTGYYRAMAYCSSTPGGWGLYIIGAWRGARSGQWSIAMCPSSHRYLVDGYTEKKG